MLKKPFSSVQAAFYLSSFTSGGVERATVAPQAEKPSEYRKEFSSDRSKMKEMSVISLAELDEATTTDLHNLINSFK